MAIHRSVAIKLHGNLYNRFATTTLPDVVSDGTSERCTNPGAADAAMCTGGTVIDVDIVCRGTARQDPQHYSHFKEHFCIDTGEVHLEDGGLVCQLLR